MKWRGCFLFFLLSFWLISGVRGQLISLSVKNASLEKVFLLIEQQSDHHFIYSNESLAKARPVTLSVSGETLNSVLKKCFASQPLQFTIHEKNITVKEKPIPRSIHQLKGKLVNEGSEPVPGLTITIRGYNLQTTSDANGNFQFDDVPDAAVLLVTGAEIEPMEIPVGNQSYMLITVQARLSTLDETFVIAYGKSTRRYSTGTVTSIKKEEISKQPVSNILSVLSGRVPGLQVSQVSGVPGSYIKVQLRGTNSLANGNDPLIILDGIPFPSQPLNGSLGGGATVAASPLNSINPSDIESIEILKDADATAIYGSRGANGVILITTKKASEGTTRVSFRVTSGAGKITRGQEMMKTPEYLIMRREAFANDGFTPTTSNARDLMLWDTTRFTDWQKELIGNTMYTKDIQASVSGGSAQTHILVNIGYHKETTVYPGDFGETRKSINLTAKHQSPNNRFDLSLTAGYSHYFNNLPQQDLFSDITLPPNAPSLYTSDGNLNWENSTWTNPLAKLNAHFITRTDNLNANLAATYSIARGLRFRLNGGVNDIRTRDHTPKPQASYNPSLTIASSSGFGSKTVQTFIGEPQLEYHFKRRDFDFSVLTGVTLQQSYQRSLYQSGTGYSSDELLGSLKAAAQVTTLSESDIEYRYLGYFGRIRYSYNKKYLVSLNVRRDGSSRYGEENRFSNFWSAALGWIFTNEHFLKESNIISFGKLKASVGTTGNDQIGDYKYLKLYIPATYPYLGVIPFYPSQHYNPEYGWEKVIKTEVGLDLGLFRDRVLVGLNYYHNKTRNQLLNYPLPAVTGFNGVLRNIPALIRNNGLEGDLKARVINNKRITWEIVANISFPYNKLIAFDGLETSSYATRFAIGKPLSIVKTFRYLGVDQNNGTYQFTDFDGNGQISSPTDQAEILYTGHQFFGGVQNNFTLGSLQVSFLLQFSRRKYAENYLYLFGRPGIMRNQPAWIIDRWQKPGDIADFQRYAVSNPLANPAFGLYQQSNAAYSDASYIRLRNLAISYDLSNVFLKSGKSTQCKLFIEGHNLITITGYKGLDPENSTQLVPPVLMLIGGFQITF